MNAQDKDMDMTDFPDNLIIFCYATTGIKNEQSEVVKLQLNPHEFLAYVSTVEIKQGCNFIR